MRSTEVPWQRTAGSGQVNLLCCGGFASGLLPTIAWEAERAGVKKLALYHHAPERDDRGIEKLAALAKKLHAGAFAAREGLEIRL